MWVLIVSVPDHYLSFYFDLDPSFNFFNLSVYKMKHKFLESLST